MVDVPLMMHWRLRSQAGAFCKGDTVSAVLAMLTGGTVVFFRQASSPMHLLGDKHSGHFIPYRTKGDNTINEIHSIELRAVPDM